MNKITHDKNKCNSDPKKEKTADDENTNSSSVLGKSDSLASYKSNPSDENSGTSSKKSGTNSCSTSSQTDIYNSNSQAKRGDFSQNQNAHDTQDKIDRNSLNAMNSDCDNNVSDNYNCHLGQNSWQNSPQNYGSYNSSNYGHNYSQNSGRNQEQEQMQDQSQNQFRQSNQGYGQNQHNRNQSYNFQGSSDDQPHYREHSYNTPQNSRSRYNDEHEKYDSRMHNRYSAYGNPNSDYENKQRFYQNSNYNTQQSSGYGSNNAIGDRNVRNYNNEQEDYSTGRGRNYSPYYNQYDDGNNYANLSGQRAYNDYSSNGPNRRKPKRW
jgi:hypothetical protein